MIPVSFTKDKRFRAFKNGGYSVEYKNTQGNLRGSTQGSSFGYGQRYQFGLSNKSMVRSSSVEDDTPAPNHYKVTSQSFDFKSKRARNRLQNCTFGESFKKYVKTCDLQKSIKIYDSKNKPGSGTY